MFDHNTHSIPGRIVSVSQPFVRPIVRGKAGCPVEFGAKLDISVADGWTRLEYSSFDAYSEAGNLQEIVERFAHREGHYPKRILVDKIYRNRENLNFCKEHGIRLSGPALGRPKKDAAGGGRIMLNLRKIQLALSVLWPFLLKFFLSAEKFVSVQ